METDAAKASAAAIVTGLKKAGIDFVATLPDEKMVELIRAVEDLWRWLLTRSVLGVG